MKSYKTKRAVGNILGYIVLIIISIIAYRFSDFIEDYRITEYPIIFTQPSIQH